MNLTTNGPETKEQPSAVPTFLPSWLLTASSASLTSWRGHSRWAKWCQSNRSFCRDSRMQETHQHVFAEATPAAWTQLKTSRSGDATHTHLDTLPSCLSALVVNFPLEGPRRSFHTHEWGKSSRLVVASEQILDFKLCRWKFNGVCGGNKMVLLSFLTFSGGGLPSVIVPCQSYFNHTDSCRGDNYGKWWKISRFHEKGTTTNILPVCFQSRAMAWKSSISHAMSRKILRKKKTHPRRSIALLFYYIHVKTKQK